MKSGINVKEAEYAKKWVLDEEYSFTLMAPPENIAVRPSYPDRWMLFQGMSVKFPGRRDNVFLPSVDKIVRSHNETKDTDHPSIWQLPRATAHSGSCALGHRSQSTAAWLSNWYGSFKRTACCK